MIIYMILILVAVVLLAGSAFRGPNPVWGGAIVGTILSIMASIAQRQLPLSLAWYGISLGAIVGFFAGLLDNLYVTRKKQDSGTDSGPDSGNN